MSVELLETIKQQINQLNSQEQEQLEQYLHEQKRSHEVSSQVPMEIAERERKRHLRAAWLKAHQDEYGGLYVALDGDRLLGTGKNYPEAYEAAKQAGIRDAYVDFVYPENDEGEMGGWV